MKLELRLTREWPERPSAQAGLTGFLPLHHASGLHRHVDLPAGDDSCRRRCRFALRARVYQQVEGRATVPLLQRMGDFVRNALETDSRMRRVHLPPKHDIRPEGECVGVCATRGLACDGACVHSNTAQVGVEARLEHATCARLERLTVAERLRGGAARAATGARAIR